MKYLNLIILLLFLLACQDKKKEEVRRLVSEWQGKEIRFPQDMVFTRFTTDTVDFTLPKSSHKVLIFVDYRVGQGHYCPLPPSEPYMRVSPHTAQAFLSLCSCSETGSHYFLFPLDLRDNLKHSS